MDKFNRLEKFQNQYGKNIVFSFRGSDFIFILIGYPVWKSFIVSSKINFSVEVAAEINLKKQTITIPERKTEDKKKHSGSNPKKIFTENELKKISSFFSLIPTNIFDAVKVYPDSHWEIIKTIIYLGNNFETFINTNPVLAYIVVNLQKFNASYSVYTSHIFFAANVIFDKQIQILEYARFHPTKQTVKILSKLDIALVSVENLKMMRSFFNSHIEEKKKIIKLLSHQKKINLKHFNLIFKHQKLLKLLSFKAINEIVELKNYDDKISTLKSIDYYIKNLNVQLPLVKSLRNLEKILENVKKKEKKRREKENKFPPPPLEGNDFIIPITTKRELIYWAKRQINCIRSYEEPIKSRKNYFYKVIYKNEEASLQLILTKKTIRLGSLLATRNKAVSSRLKKMVNEWFQEKYLSKNIYVN